MTLASIIALADAIEPYMQPAEQLGAAVVAAVKAIAGIGQETDAQADADLEQLVTQAMADKAARDAAAAGNDPQ